MLPAHQTLLLCAQLASAAYENEKYAERQVATLGCTCFNFHECAETDTQAISVLHNDSLIVAFRGTSSRKDAGTDLDFPLTAPFEQHPDLLLHRGFLAAATSLSRVGFMLNDMLNDMLDDVLDEDLPYAQTIILTGHSLGGALAQTAAILLSAIREIPRSTPLHVITYGAPRVTNPANATRQWPFRLDMCEMIGDPVPDLPPRLLGYEHLTQATIIPLPNRGILTPDHPISGYIEAIKRMP